VGPRSRRPRRPAAGPGWATGWAARVAGRIGRAVARRADALPSGTRWIVLSGAATLLAALLASAVFMVHLRRHALWDAERELANIALVLTRHMESSFTSARLLQADLLAMVDELDIRDAEQFSRRLATEAVHQRLAAHISALPQIEALFFSNADGTTVVSSRRWPHQDFSIADRPHFSVLRERPQLEGYLAPPARNVQTGTWNIYLTRRVVADDDFLGVVGIGFSLAWLQEFFGGIALGEGSAIALWRDDGTLLARHPHTEAIGRAPMPGLLMQRLSAGTGAGTGRIVSAIDGVDRLIAVRHLAGDPVVVTVTRGVAEVLRPWQRLLLYGGGAFALFALVVLAAVLGGIRQVRGRELLDRAREELRVLEEQRRTAAQIAHLAHHDPLTGLANRALFGTMLDEAVARAARGEAFAVLCLDLDHFKDVNDTLGHPVGDLLLCAATARVKAQIRDTDTIARLGGDELAVILPRLGGPGEAADLARRIVECLGEPFSLEGHHVIVGASIGIAVAPGDGLDPAQLLRNADMALYRAKAEGRGRFRFFEPEMNAHAQARRSLQLDLHRAWRAGEFELYFQPQVHLPTRRTVGYEALLRWNHPERGLVPPDRFVPLAEENGLIVPLGRWVLEQACAAAAGWPGQLKVAVNLSPVQFASPDLTRAVLDALGGSGLDPSRLELEITETVLLRDAELVFSVLHRLRRRGISVALDDFGTGYSSLSYLHRFPFSRVKIDKGFVHNLGRTRESDAIVRAVTGLCAALEISTTAEGVELETQAAALLRFGCTEAQGYLFGAPRPARTLFPLRG